MEWDTLGRTPEDLYTPEQMNEARELIKAEIEKTPALDSNMWKVRISEQLMLITTF
jgi:hypothetical protein